MPSLFSLLTQVVRWGLLIIVSNLSQLGNSLIAAEADPDLNPFFSFFILYHFLRIDSKILESIVFLFTFHKAQIC
jgi:hypothetical protein